MHKTLAVTTVVVVLVALAAAASLFTLSAVSGRQTCGKVNQAELRAPAAPDYAKMLEQLARCGR